MTKIKVHDDWHPHPFNYDEDIAMMTLEDEVSFTRFIKPICLWNFDFNPSNTAGCIAGWGKSSPLSSTHHEEVPNQLNLSVHTNKNCFLKHNELAAISSNRTFCAGNGDEVNVCHGDSGSGFVVEHESHFHLQGIVSASSLNNLETCDVTKHAIFTNVLKFKQWIGTFIGNESTSISAESDNHKIQAINNNVSTECANRNANCEPQQTCILDLF